MLPAGCPMFKSTLVYVTGAVMLLSGCADFSLPKRTDGVSSSTGLRTQRSTKHASSTPANVIATAPGSKTKNEPKEPEPALASKPTRSSSATASKPTNDDTELRDVVAIVGSDRSSRSFANEDVVSVSTSSAARQPVVDLDQLNAAPLSQRAIPDRPRLYAFGPTKPGVTLADVADQLLPSARVTIAQMMWALYRKNPDAFVNKNINSLKPKSLLNVPELDELMAISRADAETQITRLHGSFKTKISASF